MAAIYSKFLVPPQLVTVTAIQWAYTCPSGKVALVKELYAATFAAAQFTWYWRSSSGGTTQVVDLFPGAAAFQESRDQVRLVLEEGNQLGYNFASTAGARVYASGYEFVV